jgi:hypothetical protein
VDSHLKPFQAIMENEIMEEKTIEKETTPNG